MATDLNILMYIIYIHICVYIYMCVCVYVYVYILLCILVQDVFFNTVLIMSHNGHVDKIILRTHADVYIYIFWLVVWNIFYFSIQLGISSS